MHPTDNLPTYKALADVTRHHIGGAGGNRTPVHQAMNVRATTVPDSLPDAGRPAGRLIATRAIPARAFPGVSKISCRHRSFSPSSPASVAGLRLIGPVRHFWSRC